MVNHLSYDEEIFTLSRVAGQCCQLPPLDWHSSVLSACRVGKGLGRYDGVLRDCRDDDLTRGGKKGAVQMNSYILVALKMLTLHERIQQIIDRPRPEHWQATLYKVLSFIGTGRSDLFNSSSWHFSLLFYVFVCLSVLHAVCRWVTTRWIWTVAVTWHLKAPLPYPTSMRSLSLLT